ncbi:hypothetical protein Tco_0853292 [Tanacetum coccineum]
MDKHGVPPTKRLFRVAMLDPSQGFIDPWGKFGDLELPSVDRSLLALRPSRLCAQARSDERCLPFHTHACKEYTNGCFVAVREGPRTIRATRSWHPLAKNTIRADGRVSVVVCAFNSKVCSSIVDRQKVFLMTLPQNLHLWRNRLHRNEIKWIGPSLEQSRFGASVATTEQQWVSKTGQFLVIGSGSLPEEVGKGAGCLREKLEQKLGSSCYEHCIGQFSLSSATSMKQLEVEKSSYFPWATTALSSCLTNPWICSRMNFKTFARQFLFQKGFHLCGVQ